MISLPENFKPKSFWEKPEGTTGMIFALLLVGGAGWLAFKLLPLIITLLQNTILATIFGVVAFALLWILSQRRTWIFLGSLYKTVMRNITNIFVSVFPIDIMKEYILDAKKSAESMAGHISNLRGQMRQVKEAIDRNEAERQNAMRLASKARGIKDTQQLYLKSRRAGRLKNSNVTLQGLYVKMEILYRVLNKMHQVCLIIIEDMTDEVDTKEREWKSIKAAHSAMQAAKRVIQGDTDKLDMFNMALEYTTSQYGQKLGEIENFVDMSAEFIGSIDLQNMVYEEDALAELEKWEKQGDSLLLGDEKTKLIAIAQDPSNILDLSLHSPAEGEFVAAGQQGKKGSFSGFFEKN